MVRRHSSFQKSGSAFDVALTLPDENIEWRLNGHALLPWANFLLNPRRLRGSDFLMRWSQGVWSERTITQAVNATSRYLALPYGPSGVAPSDDVRAYELYFERLEKAGLGKGKRPDLLIFPATVVPTVLAFVENFGGLSELPFRDEKELQPILKRAILAVECENSLWKATMMPDYQAPLKPQKRLGGRLGLKANAVLPTIIIKEEDREPLYRWQRENNVAIHIWHLFFDKAFGLPLDEATRLIVEGLIQPTIQTFQAPGGATTKKAIYKIYHHYAYALADAIEEPELVAAHIVDKNGHILPYVRFEGGRMTLAEAALAQLEQLTHDQN
jgi:hypothetical protein